VLDLAGSAGLDVESVDMLADLAGRLAGRGVDLRLANVRERAHELLGRRGLLPRVRVPRSIDGAVVPGTDTTPASEVD
jgi:hypothetical protein